MDEDEDERPVVIPPKRVFSSAAEVAEARARRALKRGRVQPKVRTKYIDRRRTVRKCISVPPEIFVRAQRDLGGGNFSKAVVEALKREIRRFDRENGVIR